MPHKRNPISAETISGLSRVLRGNLQAGMQDVALWHERDISHSSVERIILPDSSLMAYYVMRRMQRLLAGLQVFPERMRSNLDSSFGLVFSQPVLLALVQGGLGRDEAYGIVQDNAAQAWHEERHFGSCWKPTNGSMLRRRCWMRRSICNARCGTVRWCSNRSTM